MIHAFDRSFIFNATCLILNRKDDGRQRPAYQTCGDIRKYDLRGLQVGGNHAERHVVVRARLLSLLRVGQRKGQSGFRVPRVRDTTLANQASEDGFNHGIDVDFISSELDTLFVNFCVLLPEIGRQVDPLDGQPGSG